MGKKYAHDLSRSKYIGQTYSPVKYKAPLKRSLSGYEIELMLIDEKGDVSNGSERVIRACRRKGRDFPISKEVGKNMIEIHALPHSKIKRTTLYLIDNLEKTAEVCEKLGLGLLPLGTYPGKFREEIWEKDRYVHVAKAIGSGNYYYFYSHCCGFHYHYTLPRGLFDREKKFLNEKFRSRVKKTLLDSYNFLISSDPAVTTLSQCSPFEGGKYYAKDTRMLFLRGGRKLRFDGLYANHQLLGGLSPYKQTLADLISTLNRKDAKMRKLLERSGAPLEFIRKKDKLDLVWNPVKINRLGTIEKRGMDTNHLEISLSLCVMLKFVLRAIQQEFYHVIPSDVGIDEPFKLEGNIIFIPPHTHVRKTLQYKSAYHGLADDDIHKYCSRFFSLARRLIYRHYGPLLGPIKDMIDDRETVSDQIIRYARKHGYRKGQPLSPEISRKIALHHSSSMLRRLEKARKNMEKVD